MFKKSDFFIILAVMISFFISAYLWFVIKDPQQAIFTAIWIPAIFTFGIYFKLCAMMRQKKWRLSIFYTQPFLFLSHWLLDWCLPLWSFASWKTALITATLTGRAKSIEPAQFDSNAWYKSTWLWFLCLCQDCYFSQQLRSSTVTDTSGFRLSFVLVVSSILVRLQALINPKC